MFKSLNSIFVGSLVYKSSTKICFDDVTCKLSNSWFLCLRYEHAKRKYRFFTPVELISNTYAPTASMIGLLDVPPVKRRHKSKSDVVDEYGKLQHPPQSVSQTKHDSSASKKSKKYEPGVIPIIDLLTGEYERQQYDRKQLMKIQQKKKISKQQSDASFKAREKEMRGLRELEADLPMDVDSQRYILCAQVDKEQSKPVNNEDLEKIQYYTNECLGDDFIEPYPKALLENALLKVSRSLFKKFHTEIMNMETQIRSDYYFVMRKFILDNILLDPKEWERLGIKTYPIGFPSLVIRGPVPWHQNTVTAKHLNFHNLFIGMPVLRALRDLWDSEWLPKVADIFLYLRDSWAPMVPRSSEDSLKQVEKFFSCACSIMSRQLRALVMNSLYHMLDFLLLYQKGNEIQENHYEDMMFTLNPMLIVKAVPAVGSTPEILFEPSLLDLKGLVQNLFYKIIRVNDLFPRVEQIMFPEMKEKALFLHSVQIEEEEVQNILKVALHSFDMNTLGPTVYLECYRPYFYIFSGEATSSLEDFFKVEPFPSLRDFASRIESYDSLKDEVYDLRQNIPLNLIDLDCTKVNDTLWKMISQLHETITDYFANVCRNHNREIALKFEGIISRVGDVPETTAQLVELTNFIIESRDVTMFDLKTQLQYSAKLILFLMTYAHLPDEDIYLNSRVFTWPKDLEQILELSMVRVSQRRDVVEGILKNKRAEFDLLLKEHHKELEYLRKKDPPLLTMEEMVDTTTTIEAFVNILAEDKITADSINMEEKLLEFEVTPFLELQNMLTAVEPYNQLWHTILEFHKKYEIWYNGPFANLNAEEIKETVDSMWSILYKLSKTFYDVPGSKRIAEIVRAKVEKFKQLIPVLQTVCNPGLRDRHWEQISEVAGFSICPRPESTLAEMIDFGLIKFTGRLEEISVSATKEYDLETNLLKMQGEWTDIKFTCIPHRDTGVYVLASVDDIQVMLDDHILKAQTMRGSPHVKPFEREMQAWEEKLISMQDILDVWLQVQATWMYLEPIFGSEDIMRQMPEEARSFKTVDKTWKLVMSNTVNDLHVITATDFPDLLKMLRESNQLLEDIQRGLNDYLEKKRIIFPRFFFLSDNELLEILSETKDPLRVEPHLKKLFEGIDKLDFQKDGTITGMISAENENVPLSGIIVPADAKELVEKWLTQVEELMVQSLCDLINVSVHTVTSRPWKEWVMDGPGMAILCAASVNWTKEVEQAFIESTLEKCLDRSNQRIDELINLVNGKLTAGHRITLGSLINTEVHARDILEVLISKKINQSEDFFWLRQLRYYSIDDRISVSMVDTTINFGYEYLGNTPILVITPLTDRCYRIMMAALQLNLGGLLEGPAASGKTETVKALAKTVAKQCIIFNCTENLGYRVIGKFFKGIAQAGAWSCFDELNRIQLQVLSVIAQQVQNIHAAIISKTERFIFEGIEITINPSCAIFITLNPGTIGCHPLPDNLKARFRPVALLVPDFTMICVVSLFAAGFRSAKRLAEKLVTTCDLCSALLSSQFFYDFGMRTIKTILNLASELKLRFPSNDESSIVLQAIVNVNHPKMLSQDIQLALNIYRDLFPDAVPIPDDSTKLVDALKNSLKKHNLQATEFVVSKLLQLYEVIVQRHSIILVGEPFSGKTCSYQVLAESIGYIKDTTSEKMKETKIPYKIINPKAVTMGQLFGQFDAESHEWSDGIIANALREFTSGPSLDKKWLVFDGPIDPIWIENLNSVMDENKKFCLMSGEIIKVSNKISLIFETNDLEHASPSSISRCGVVYFDPKNLGWKTLMKSFICTLTEKLTSDQLDSLSDLLEWLISPILNFVLNSCTFFIGSSEMHLFSNFSRLFLCLIQEENIQKSSIQWVQCTLLFAIFWGFGSFLTGDGKTLFNRYIRQLCSGEIEEHPRPVKFKLTKNQMFPEKISVFDAVYDKKNNGQWIPWLEIADKAPLSPNAKANSLIIPTEELTKQRFFLRLLLNSRIPVLFIGPSGTGKSLTVLDHLANAPKNKFISNSINFSGCTSANQTQDIIMSKLDRRRKGVFGPQMGKQYILFIDDLSISSKDSFGTQPPIELLRQWVDHKHWYDLNDKTRIDLVDILFVGVSLPPGGGSHNVCFRFLRHMLPIGSDLFEDKMILGIFTKILDWHLAKGFNENICRLSQAVIKATLHIYKMVTCKFLPSPTQCQYRFNLRDCSRVVNGILQLPSTRCPESENLLRLWVHETTRVFSDRLLQGKEQKEFFNALKESSLTNLKCNLNELLADEKTSNCDELKFEHLSTLIFGSFMEPSSERKVYDEIKDMDALKEKMEFYLKEYNSLCKKPMSMVMFWFAIEHISRVVRILEQDNGNVLLIGIGGSGRQSIVKLAAHIADYSVFQINIIKSYSMENWREDLKTLLCKAGCDGKAQTFLIVDGQIVDDLILEDINTILHTGDIPNLFASDEKTDIVDKMVIVSRDLGSKIDTTPLALYNFFLERVKSNVRFAFAMSPIGKVFRHRIRSFPFLINLCTIDGFCAWPEDALEKVAQKLLSDSQLSEQQHGQCALISKEFHLSVVDAAKRFHDLTKRPIYITPTSYLELIKTFRSLHGMKVDEITTLRTRYEIGLEKLDFAASQVIIMQNELHVLQPQLKLTSEQTEKLMVKIEQDTVNVEASKEIVAADEALANEAAAASQAIKDDCESDLAEATPALESAIAALNTLKPADITVVKSMKNPPATVKLVMEAVCVMKGIKSERRPDASGSGAMIEDYWGPSLKLLGDLKFLDSLKTYDKDNINPSVMKLIREKYVSNRYFDPAVVKSVSNACEGLCKWIRAMEVYDRVIKIVGPKKAKLAEAEADYALQMEKLNEKRAQLQKVTGKLQALRDELAEKTREKKELEDSIELCSQKLDRAEKLIGGLGGEKTRWSETARQLQVSLNNSAGDVLLAAGIVAYLGAFSIQFRNELVDKWNQCVIETGLACAGEFSLINTLGNPVLIRSWNIHGLPIDNFSIENGIIVSNACRWPLMIDPQGQANKWIKNMEQNNNLVVIKLTDKNYLQVLEEAIGQGTPVLLENVLEDIDAAIDPILLKDTINQGDQKYIKLGENQIPYHTNFRFYITTCLRNPHYLPEIAVKVTLLNFMITTQGLQDQLLSVVVSMERPELEEKKNELIIEGANNKRMLKEIEDKILGVLSASQGNILEDETAIKILSSSKVLSAEIQAKQGASTQSEMAIDSARNLFLPIAEYSSVLFFSIIELANVDPMYQFSLLWFLNLYNQSILKSEHSDKLEERLVTLKYHLTKSVFHNVCRSIFERDKLVFAFSLVLGILRSNGKVNEELLKFVLMGGVASQIQTVNPVSSWLSHKAWSDVLSASELPGMQELKSTIESRPEDWKAFYDSSESEKSSIPVPFQNIQEIGLLVILRCLRPDRIVAAVEMLIAKELGEEFVQSRVYTLSDSFKDSNCCSPMIFILSRGFDPMEQILKFAGENGIQESSLLTISLGQGQNPIAINMITTGVQSGQWVILKNCHLAPNLMRELDRICSEVISLEKTNPKFRLWLTSYPSDVFPISVLQNGIKIVAEIPKNLQSNLLRSLSMDPICSESFFPLTEKNDEWFRMQFNICFFHAVAQERCKFGRLGWIVPYEFNDSDLIVGVTFLKSLLMKYDVLEKEALVCLLEECDYGGQIKDNLDKNLLNSLLNTYICCDLLGGPVNGCLLTKETAPEEINHETLMKYVSSFQSEMPPEVFGLHCNANIAKEQNESFNFLMNVMKTQAQISDEMSEETMSKVVADKISVILEKAFKPFKLEEVIIKFPPDYNESLNSFLLQELERFNSLMETILSSLEMVQKAIKGSVSMSLELEAIFTDMLYDKVPSSWMSNSYLSLKTLPNYINDLADRIRFFFSWASGHIPLVFPLSHFFCAQSFIAAVMVNYSRVRGISINELEFKSEFIRTMPQQGQLTKKEESDIFCQGLYLEGAHFNADSQSLVDSIPKVLFEPLPLICFKPREKKLNSGENIFECPLYKTRKREDLQSTRLFTKNFICHLHMKTSEKASHWINSGVSIFCEID
ncbi:dynein axonemal heavy chain 3 isoform X4 [Bemisia tabaci]|uniref:dynein axonemal heavy chain 3 isoform X4 n=1 Tax=Bemisia tabaci TaxID=7038 RepID=UPI003B280703